MEYESYPLYSEHKPRYDRLASILSIVSIYSISKIFIGLPCKLTMATPAVPGIGVPATDLPCESLHRRPDDATRGPCGTRW